MADDEIILHGLFLTIMLQHVGRTYVASVYFPYKYCENSPAELKRLVDYYFSNKVALILEAETN